MYRLQRACEVQLLAQGAGGRFLIPPREVCERSGELSDDFLPTEGGKGYSRVANPEFAAMLRLMDCKDPSYRE
jgi:hypothetical protein